MKRDALAARVVIEEKEKGDIVGEDHNLALFCFRSEPAGDAPPVVVVERANGVVQHDSGPISSRIELRENPGKGNARSLALT